MNSFIRGTGTVLLFIIVVACSSITSAQTLQFGFGGGLVMPQGNYGGSTAEYQTGVKYGLSTGWNAHAKARLGLLGLNLAGQIGYTSLSNSGNPAQGGGTVEVKHNVLSVKVGPEVHLSFPASPLSLYLGANGQWNSFGGSTAFQGVSGLPSKTYDLTSASRIGIGFSVGAIISTPVLPKLDVSIHYDMMNVSGKAFEQDASQDNREESYMFLNDEKDPAYAAGDTKHFIANSRSISTLAITISVLFGN